MSTPLLPLLTLAALAAPPEVVVRPLAGESQTGRLTALSPEKAVVQTKVGPRELPTAALMWLEFTATEPAEKKPDVWMELLDGSRIHAAAYTTLSGKAKIELAGGLTVETPTRSVRTVRFRQQTTPELAGQWREIVAAQAAGDLLVIRKTTTRAVEQGENEPSAVTEHALDQTEGTILDVGPDTVQFEFSGEKLDVRREKLEGLVYYQPTRREFPSPLCRLTDAGGSMWLLRELALNDDRLAAVSLGGVALEIPLAAVSKLDFSVGNVAFLADLEPDTGSGELAVSLQPAGMAYRFGRLFAVRAAPPLGADDFRIGGVRYASGLSLHSPLTLVYRVPEGFRHFHAVAGVDDSVLAPGRFDLVILGDGKELVRQPFSGDQPRRPLPLELDLAGVRRMTIVLDPADGQDIGDQLNLCEARFTK